MLDFTNGSRLSREVSMTMTACSRFCGQRIGDVQARLPHVPRSFRDFTFFLMCVTTRWGLHSSIYSCHMHIYTNLLAVRRAPSTENNRVRNGSPVKRYADLYHRTSTQYDDEGTGQS